MKLSPRDALAYFRKPDAKATGLLIYGEDAMRVAQRRQEVITALIGPDGEAEMRLTRIPASDLRKDAALLDDAIRAQSFFPGARVAFVEGATDGLAEAIGAALADWRDGDAQVIVTAAQLTAKSALRKLFEGHPRAFAIGLYDDPPTPAEIEAMLASAGLSQVSRDAAAMLAALARAIDPGDFRQTIEKLGLYKHGDSTEVTLQDFDAVAPQSAEADIDDLIAVVADRQDARIAPVLRRLAAQGVNATGICIGAMRHFRMLHAAASDPGGAAAGVGKLRPPLFGPRRDAAQRQAEGWGRDRLEGALAALLDTDLQLRSSSPVPQFALLERALIRLVRSGRRQGKEAP